MPLLNSRLPNDLKETFMNSQPYLDQAFEYHREKEWLQRLALARVPRRAIVKAGTLGALGGAGALGPLLAACTQAARQESDLAGTSAEGSYKYSKYPLIEKYNWRNLPWGGTPYVDGILQMQGSGVSNWDFVRLANTSYGTIMDNLLNKRYGTGADILRDELEGHIADKWTAARDFSYTDYHIRQGVYFHDLAPVNGRLCTADDVKYCLDVYRAEGLARSAGVIGRVSIARQETVKSISNDPFFF
jgi:ABC-type transport system substrate-binding protein